MGGGLVSHHASQGDLHPWRGFASREGFASRGSAYELCLQGGWAHLSLGTRKVGGTHPTGMLSCCTTSEENKMEVVTNTINFTVNLHLTRFFELTLR